MAEPTFEVSRAGIKLSYRRFLSDSAGGFVVLLLLLWAYQRPILFGAPLKESIGTDFTGETKIFILVLLFLLSTPIGLLMNALSWFSLGNLEISLAGRMLSKPPKFLRSSFTDFSVESYGKLFRIDAPKFCERAIFVNDALAFFFPQGEDPAAPVRGIRIFSRNMAFLLLCIWLSSLTSLVSSEIRWHEILHLLLLLPSLSLLLILTGAATIVYRLLSDLQRLYFFMLVAGHCEAEPGSLEKKVAALARAERARQDRKRD